MVVVGLSGGSGGCLNGSLRGVSAVLGPPPHLPGLSFRFYKWGHVHIHAFFLCRDEY